MIDRPVRKYIQHPGAGCAGPFFLTLCCKGRVHRFGEVRGEAMCLNQEGLVVEEAASALTLKIPGLVVYALQVMPDHVHLVVGLPADADVALGDVVRTFKGMVNLRLRQMYGVQGGVKCWQRGYYDHIIRTPDDFVNTLNYIADNPRRWAANHKLPANHIRP